MRSRLLAVAAFAGLIAAAGPASADAEQDRWAEWHLDRARALEAEGFAAEASEEWLAAACLRPSDKRAAVRAAVSFTELVTEPSKRAKRSEPGYQHAERLVADALRRGALHDAGIAYTIGRLQLADGDREIAESMFELAARRGFDPLRARLWHFRAVILNSRRLVDDGRVDLGVQRLERLLKDFPGHPDVLEAKIRLAVCYRERGEQLLAERLLKEVLAEAPWAASAHLALANCHADQERWEQATAEYEAAKARALERDDGLYTGRDVYLTAVLEQAQSDLTRDALDSCEALAKKFLELVPDHPDGLFLLGSVRQRRGKPEDLLEAAKYLRRAKRLAPGRGEIVATLIRVLSQLGETEEMETARKELEAIDAEIERRRQAPGPGGTGGAGGPR